MGALAKGVSLSFGLVTASVSVTGAVEAKVSNKSVCTGATGKDEHDPKRISQRNVCPDCGEVAYTDIRKAREVGDGLVLIEAEEIVEAKQDATLLKKKMALTAHPASEVEIQTTPGKMANYLTPDPGHETAYAVIRHMIGQHPELAFVCQWTPRSNATMFRITTRGDVLVATERVRPGNVKPAPGVTAEAPEAMTAMAEQLLQLPGTITDFDPTAYADTYEEKLQAIIASKQVHQDGTPAPASAPRLPAGQQSAMDALAAMLAAATPAPAAAPKKRAPRKKASA